VVAQRLKMRVGMDVESDPEPLGLRLPQELHGFLVPTELRGDGGAGVAVLAPGAVDRSRPAMRRA
jgi:hypothetical protein